MKVYKHEYKSATVYTTVVNEKVKIVYIKYKYNVDRNLLPSKPILEHMVRTDHISKTYKEMSEEDYEFLLNKFPKFPEGVV
jgi:hypothetical protein